MTKAKAIQIFLPEGNPRGVKIAEILANSRNGWIEWKYKDGKTLDEVKR